MNIQNKNINFLKHIPVITGFILFLLLTVKSAVAFSVNRIDFHPNVISEQNLQTVQINSDIVLQPYLTIPNIQPVIQSPVFAFQNTFLADFTNKSEILHQTISGQIFQRIKPLLTHLNGFFIRSALNEGDIPLFS